MMHQPRSLERNRSPLVTSAALSALIVATTLAWTACDRPVAEEAAAEDHTHAGGGVVTLWTDSLELFVEYPPHVNGVPSDPWAIHLTWLADWKPVQDGSLRLLFRGPGGASQEVEIQAPTRPGVFTATPTLSGTGTWRADMVLTARDREFAIPVGQLQVFEDEQALPHEEPAEAVPADLITFLKEQQWAMPFEVAVVTEREIPRSISATGDIIAPPGALAYVSAPFAGLVLARGPALAPGVAVAAGQTLALLAPTSGDDSYARLRAELESLEQEVARAERLFAAEAIAEKRLVQARRDRDVARAALEAVQGAGSGQEAGDAESYEYRLRSPIRGVVAERHVAPGQRVEAGAHAFTVVDPRTLWFRARIPAGQAEAVSAVTGGWFVVEGGERVYSTDRVISVGSVLDATTRTLPVHLAIPNPDGTLKVGMLAEGSLLVGSPESGVAVPATAVQREDGLPVAYVKLGGEAFQRRVLSLGPSDGEWTIVSSGIQAGEQVVTVGAYQVKLASVGDAEISDHGHPH